MLQCTLLCSDFWCLHLFFDSSLFLPLLPPQIHCWRYSSKFRNEPLLVEVVGTFSLSCKLSGFQASVMFPLYKDGVKKTWESFSVLQLFLIHPSEEVFIHHVYVNRFYCKLIFSSFVLSTIWFEDSPINSISLFQKRSHVQISQPPISYTLSPASIRLSWHCLWSCEWNSFFSFSNLLSPNFIGKYVYCINKEPIYWSNLWTRSAMIVLIC